jgi:hypothetical protein
VNSDPGRPRLFAFPENNSLALCLSPFPVDNPVYNRFLISETSTNYAPCANRCIFDHPPQPGAISEKAQETDVVHPPQCPHPVCLNERPS